MFVLELADGLDDFIGVIRVLHVKSRKRALLRHDVVIGDGSLGVRRLAFLCFLGNVSQRRGIVRVSYWTRTGFLLGVSQPAKSHHYGKARGREECVL
jgi:hypothetical protein